MAEHVHDVARLRPHEEAADSPLLVLEVMRDVGERWIQDPEHRRHLSEVRVKMMAAMQSAG